MIFIASTPAPLRIALIGECMIELQQRSDGQLRQSFGGDTLNTAVY
jgi:2-dehydro-3-deoxygluconokinase